MAWTPKCWHPLGLNSWLEKACLDSTVGGVVSTFLCQFQRANNAQKCGYCLHHHFMFLSLEHWIWENMPTSRYLGIQIGRTAGSPLGQSPAHGADSFSRSIAGWIWVWSSITKWWVRSSTNRISICFNLVVSSINPTGKRNTGVSGGQVTSFPRRLLLLITIVHNEPSWVNFASMLFRISVVWWHGFTDREIDDK